MIWSEEAEKSISRVPFFVRNRVRKQVEKEAGRQGSKCVLIEHVDACRQRFLSGKDIRIKGFQIETCFGSGGCKNRVLETGQLVEDLGKLLSKHDFGAFLKERVGEDLKYHHELRISISDCPNACSQPQIVDIGIIGALRPEISDKPCAGCGACAAACREGAIRLAYNEQDPVLDRQKCVQCGKCVSVCPSGALETGTKGKRILLGGKLGRRPQLGRELEGLYSSEEVLAVVERGLDLYFTHNIAGERLGSILNRIGYAVVKSAK